MHPTHSRRFGCPRAAVRLILLGAAVLWPLAGCFDNDPGLQERLVRAQADVQEKSRKIQDLETALEQARAGGSRAANPAPAEIPASAASTPAMLTREQLEETYVVAAKEMRQKVESELTGYAVQNCTLFKVEMPSVALPYTSKVALNLRSTAGQPYRLEFPVGADWSGKWSFPAPADVSATLEKAQAQAAASPRTPAAGAGGSRGGSPGPGNGATAGGPPSARPAARPPEGGGNANTETIEMSWGSNGGSRRSPGGSSAAPRQPAGNEEGSAPGGPAPQNPRLSSGPAAGNPAPAPNPGNTPRPGMPSDRDVLIQF